METLCFFVFFVFFDCICRWWSMRVFCFLLKIRRGALTTIYKYSQKIQKKSKNTKNTMFPLFLIEIIENHCVFCIFCDFCMFFVFFIEHIANFGVRNG